MSKSVQIHDPDTRETALIEPGTQALRVYSVNSPTGTSDVNIVEVGGVSVGGSSVPINDAGGSLTVDGTVAVSSVAGTVAVTQSGAWTVDIGNEPISIDDNGGSITVDGTVSVTEPVQVDTSELENAVVPGGHAVFPAGAERDDGLSTLGVADGDWTHLRVSQRGALWVEHPATVSVNVTAMDVLPEENEVVAAAHDVFPAGVVRDDALTTLGVANNDWTNLRCDSVGMLWTRSVRREITNLFSGQVLDGTPSSANSSSVDVSEFSHLVIHLRMTESGNPKDLRIIAQFSPDSGTTWHDYAVDQWVDLRYVDPQMPLNESVPLNYPTAGLFRLRIIGRGVTGSNTFTVTADLEAVA